jgi:hypothetical protein
VLYLLKYLNEMKNDRNAGRKKVKDAVMVQAKVTAKYADEYKKLAENYREYETKKSSDAK